MGCCCSQLERKVAEKFNEDEIVMKNVGWAVLNVLTTQSRCKRRGNGALVLTREKLWFRFLCCGDKELDIPLPDLTKVYVSTTLRLPGFYMRAMSPMLIIEFTAGLVAFSVPQAEIWLQQIEQTQSHNKSQEVFKGTFAK